jgi:addiction module HigA family antidote
MPQTKKLAPLHPGEVLQEEFLAPLNMSAITLARFCGVPRTRIERIIAGTTGVTADTALRLGKVLNTSPNFWLNLQNEYDIRTAKNNAGAELEKLQTAV